MLNSCYRPTCSHPQIAHSVQHLWHVNFIYMFPKREVKSREMWCMSCMWDVSFLSVLTVKEWLTENVLTDLRKCGCT